MGKFIDLTEKRFERLLVLKRSETINKRTMWLCKCDCGNMVTVNSYALLNGRTKSCGCYRKDKLRNDKITDITGQVFGELTVLSFIGSAYYNGLSNGTMWLCECSCGKRIIVRKMNLIRGLTKSCGHKSKVKDKTGQRYGLLTVERLDHIKRTENKTTTYWLCKCDCGNHVSVDGGSLVSGNTKSCGCLHSYGESIIQRELESYGLNFVHDAEFDTLLSKKGYPLKFDFMVYDKNTMILIEYQGEQHYKNVEFGKEQREITDKQKKKWCSENKIPLYEIKYDEPINNELLSILINAKLIPCQARNIS